MATPAIDHRCKYCKRTMAKGRSDKQFCNRECKRKYRNAEDKKERHEKKDYPDERITINPKRN